VKNLILKKNLFGTSPKCPSGVLKARNLTLIVLALYASFSSTSISILFLIIPELKIYADG